jgi:hypothetical protein
MTIKFSRHAVERLQERFSGRMARLTKVIESGLCQKRAVLTAKGYWCLDGVVNGMPVRVICAEPHTNEFVVITAMWVVPR